MSDAIALCQAGFWDLGRSITNQSRHVLSAIAARFPAIRLWDNSLIKLPVVFAPNQARSPLLSAFITVPQHGRPFF